MALDPLSASSPPRPDLFKAPKKAPELEIKWDPLYASTPRMPDRPRMPDLFKGLGRSGILRTLALSIIMGGLSTGVLFLIVSSPSAWMIATAAAGGSGVGFMLGIVVQGKRGRQKMSFELTTLLRLCKKRNYDEIIEFKNGTKIFLGALPNRIRSEGEHLVNNENVRAILSVNEPWEREPMGVSVPYNHQDRQDLRLQYEKLNVDDHVLLSNDQLNKAADFINIQINQGNSVYVHCRAGAGRSAMAVAAYLIKYQKFSVEKARELIKTQRPLSTIDKKLDRLQNYANIFLNIFLVEIVDSIKNRGDYTAEDNPLAIVSYLEDSKQMEKWAAFDQLWKKIDMDAEARGSFIKAYDSLRK